MNPLWLLLIIPGGVTLLGWWGTFWLWLVNTKKVPAAIAVGFGIGLPVAVILILLTYLIPRVSV